MRTARHCTNSAWLSKDEVEQGPVTAEQEGQDEPPSDAGVE
ncbi:MAG: hypothetical protein AB1714_10420 [Acidobacteriota bacterium]